ncbi:PAS sensor protein, partial [Streptomyces sp. TRM76130]|nr:PAS sensor protein [Streptomyces sp. TRM76130]
GKALWLVMVAGAPHEITTPWRRVALTDPMPVADAVRERRLVWVGGQEEMARQYPRPALVLPYKFALAATPLLSGAVVRGGLVLLFSGDHPPRLSQDERDAVRIGSDRLGELLRQAADRGDPVLPGGRPHMVPPPAGRVPSPAEASAVAAFLDRLPGGSCA